MNRSYWLAVLLLHPAVLAAAEPLPRPEVTGLKNPESVAVGPDGKVYISVIGEFDKDGDGAVLVMDKGKAVPWVTGLDDPKGLAVFQKWVYVADKKRVWRIDQAGKATVFVTANAFPTPPLFLNDLTVDPESGTLYVSDSGDLKGKGGAVYRITPLGRVETVTNAERAPVLRMPNGLAMDGASHLLLVDFGNQSLFRIKLADGSVEKVTDGVGVADGVVWDNFGRLFISDWKEGRVYVIPRSGDKPILMAEGFKSAADICVDPTGKFLLVPDMQAGTLTALPIRIPGQDVDMTPLPIQTAVAFPKLQWTGWEPLDDKGKPSPLRPITLTGAGDGSNRLFVATQHGVIHVFPNDQNATRTKVFLDIKDRVFYDDKENEQGFLGLAFHPQYKTNREFFVFYTLRQQKTTNVVARYRVSQDDPDRADPASEEVILRIAQRPFWNHDGGTLCFGPDGYLYIALGDGGLANDPFDNAQSLKTILGKILRIDVDHKGQDKNYAIPKDNPFVDRPGARPEIWAYGLRNVWRMAFDRQTGQLWAADVGQNLWEEIDLIEKGGNYGWNRREGRHPFGARGVGLRKDLIEPIWEYYHDVGKSLTGGLVYRGKRLPELAGSYLYGDYVSAKMWALKYDGGQKRVVANRPIADRNLPLLSFGEDDKGEVYFLTYTNSGQGIYWFVRGK
jgi:glucose/arabinose dehydrogenase